MHSWNAIRSGCLAALLAALLSGAVQAQPKPTVKLVVNYGDGVEKHFTAIAWREGMTVLDAMRAANEHPRGIKFEFTGEGERAFLSSIDGVSNEGGGRNWIYRVNGETGDRSFAVKGIAAGDVIHWTFGPYGDK
jgi:hypothetical protein